MAVLTEARDVVLGRRKVYYGWWLLAASVAAMALGSGVSFWSFGFYVQPLEQEFGWSRAQVSLGFSSALLVSGFSGPLVGRWVDRKGPRSAIILGGVLTAATYLLLSTTDALWQWYAYSSLNALARQLMFFIPFMALISRWFDRKRGIAVSILGTGFSMGGFLVVPIVGQSIEVLEWRGTLVASGIAIAAVFIPIGLFIVRNNPADVGALVDGTARVEGQPSSPPRLYGLTLEQALRTPLFWAMSVGLMLFFYGMFGWLVHQVPFYQSIGLSRGTAATIVSLAAGSSIVARLVLGAVADRIARFELAVVGLALFLITAMATLAISTSPLAIGIFLVCWILGTSGGPMMEALLLTRAFGVAHFATILGVVIVVETFGQIVSPTVAGAIYDATGSYDAAVWMFLGTFTAACLMFLVILRMPRPVFESAEASADSEATR